MKLLCIPLVLMALRAGAVSAAGPATEELPLFDTRMYYNAEARSVISPRQVIDLGAAPACVRCWRPPPQ